MDDARFDAITRRLATPRSRRGALSALLAGVGGIALLGRTAAAPLRTCSGSNFDCPGKQLCGLDDATQQLVCKAVTGVDRDFRVCKGEFEVAFCQHSSQCCVYPGIRDPGGLQLVANCCDNGLICDTQRGCVPRPGAG